jgi:hypothetical protein
MLEERRQGGGRGHVARGSSEDGGWARKAPEETPALEERGPLESVSEAEDGRQASLAAPEGEDDGLVSVTEEAVQGRIDLQEKLDERGDERGAQNRGTQSQSPVTICPAEGGVGM